MVFFQILQKLISSPIDDIVPEGAVPDVDLDGNPTSRIGVSTRDDLVKENSPGSIKLGFSYSDVRNVNFYRTFMNGEIVDLGADFAGKQDEIWAIQRGPNESIREIAGLDISDVINRIRLVYKKIRVDLFRGIFAT